MNTLVAEKKNQSRLVARFPEKEFDDSISPLAERFGGPQLFVERLVRWFQQQPPEAQAMIQGQIPASPDLVEYVLRKLYGSVRSQVKGERVIEPVHDVPPNLKAAAAKVIVDVDRPAREKAKGKRGE